MLKESHFCPNCGQCHFEGEINGTVCRIITSKNNENYVIQIYDDSSGGNSEFKDKNLTRLNQKIKGFNLRFFNPKIGCITC